MKKLYILLVTIFAFNFSNAQIDFQDHIVISNHGTTEGATSVYTADIDGDGDLDVVCAAFSDDKIAWYENIDSQGLFGTQNIINTNAAQVSYVFAADLDGDGDIDVLSASEVDDKIAWYENIDGQGNFGAQQIITINAEFARSVHAADIDGDGDMDVLSASAGDHKIAWYENTDGLGNFGGQQIITDITNTSQANSVYTIDIDGDGDLDVLSASRSDYKIAWYENTDGLGSFGPQMVITTNAMGAWSVYSVDIDNDGDNDVFSTSTIDHKIAWYENLDGNGSFGAQQIISTEFRRPRTIYSSDFDGDGDIDILSTGSLDNTVVWFENINGQGDFGVGLVITTETDGPYSIHASDINGDGYVDVLSASRFDDKIAWYENTDGNGNFGAQQNITRFDAINRPQSTYAIDIDGDGDIDVLSASRNDDKIAWYENRDGNGSFGSQQIITTNAKLAVSVFAKDLDGDGDEDVISSSDEWHIVAWYENIDGLGNFGTQQIFPGILMSPSNVFSADIDGDGDFDVICASTYGSDQKVVWYENTNGLGNFGNQQIITTNVNYVREIYSSDIDSDGDMDVLVVSYSGQEIFWVENLNGLGNFGTPQIIAAEINPISVFAIDIDNDGDTDVIGGFSHKVVWYENTNGIGNFSLERIISNSVNDSESIYAADMDNDGDMDVISALISDNKIIWYENIDGLGNFSQQLIVSTNLDSPISIIVSDVDADGDNDIISASVLESKISWHENLSILEIEDNTITNFKLFPNPVQEILNIETQGQIESIKIYSLQGQLIKEDSRSRVDVSQLDIGFYFIQITIDGKTVTKKFIKE